MSVSGGGGDKSIFFMFMAVWFGLIAELNYSIRQPYGTISKTGANNERLKAI